MIDLSELAYGCFECEVQMSGRTRMNEWMDENMNKIIEWKTAKLSNVLLNQRMLNWSKSEWKNETIHKFKNERTNA